MQHCETIDSLSNEVLLQHIEKLLHKSAELTVRLLDYLNEVEARHLHSKLGYSSLFAFCTGKLGLSESATFKRIQAARLMRRFPVIRERLEQRAVHLTTLTLLSTHLTEDNHLARLDACRNKSKREVEKIIAAWAPRADVPTSVRKLPERTTSRPMAAERVDAPLLATQPDTVAQGAAATESAPVACPPPKQPAKLEALSPVRYRVQFTASEVFHEKLRLAQDLLGHQVASKDVEAVLEKALDALLAHKLQRKLGLRKAERQAVIGRLEEGGEPAVEATERDAPQPLETAEEDVASSGTANLHESEKEKLPTRPRSRHVPNAARREVFARDGLQCQFVGQDGHRCGARALLEIEHLLPFGQGGDHEPQRLTVLCRSHNGYRAEQVYGRRLIEQRIEERRSGRTSP